MYTWVTSLTFLSGLEFDASICLVTLLVLLVEAGREVISIVVALLDFIDAILSSSMLYVASSLGDSLRDTGYYYLIIEVIEEKGGVSPGSFSFKS